MAYPKSREIRISSVIIANNKIVLPTTAETLSELITDLANYDDPNFGKQVVDLNLHQLQISHKSLPQGTLLTNETRIPEDGFIAINISAKDNTNG